MFLGIHSRNVMLMLVYPKAQKSGIISLNDDNAGS